VQPAKEDDDTVKINNYYRSRVASLLTTLSASLKEKQRQEQLAKEKKER
jgi:hypothetical protein